MFFAELTEFHGTFFWLYSGLSLKYCAGACSARAGGTTRNHIDKKYSIVLMIVLTVIMHHIKYSTISHTATYYIQHNIQRHITYSTITYNTGDSSVWFRLRERSKRPRSPLATNLNITKKSSVKFRKFRA